MCLACNLLLSVGGTPSFYKKQRLPSYPGPVPHHRSGFHVDLERFSPDLLRNVSAEHPEVVQRLLGLAEKAREDLGDSLRDLNVR